MLESAVVMIAFVGRWILGGQHGRFGVYYTGTIRRYLALETCSTHFHALHSCVSFLEVCSQRGIEWLQNSSDYFCVLLSSMTAMELKQSVKCPPPPNEASYSISVCLVTSEEVYFRIATVVCVSIR